MHRLIIINEQLGATTEFHNDEEMARARFNNITEISQGYRISYCVLHRLNEDSGDSFGEWILVNDYCSLQ